MEVIGYLSTLLIGISLGIIGGGGSILTVPVLVYLFTIDAIIATTYSLFIVGISSAVGSFFYFKRGLVNIKTAVIFGIPSIIAVFFTRTYLVPIIPIEIFTVGSFTVTKNILMMLLFAALMLAASYSMIKPAITTTQDEMLTKKLNYTLTLLQGVFVGTVTGLIGAGGGFLIIPVLINFLKLPMKVAVGTSLLIITINSLTGFMFSITKSAIEWRLLLSIVFLAMIGVFVGIHFSEKIDGKKLKPAFGWFVLVMGICIIIKETVLK